MTAVPRFGAFVALAGAVVAGCGEPMPVAVAGPDPASPQLLAGATGLLQCTSLPADSLTQVVGPAGGTVAAGPHRLDVPAGALAEPVAITAVAGSGPERRVAFNPEGLVFAEPASLTMSYAGCGLVGLPSLRIAYVEDDLSILEYLPSSTDVLSQEVTGRLRHFSNYAIAW